MSVIAAALASLLVLQSTFGSELQEITDDLASRLNIADSVTTVAVIEFVDLEGDRTSLGKFLSDQFSVRLLDSAGFELFNRSRLRELIAEIQLSEDGLVSPESAKRLELEGVEVLITGTVTELGESAQLSVQALRTSTARIVAAATGRIPLTGDLQHLVGRRIYGNDESAISATPTSSQLVLPGAKDVGPFRITLTDLSITETNRSDRTRVSATFEVLNRSSTEYLVGVASTRHGSSVTDNRGNFFELDGGLEPIYNWRVYGKEALTVPPGGQVSATLIFVGEDVEADDLGDRFAVTWLLRTLNMSTDRDSQLGVSFRDVALRR